MPLSALRSNQSPCRIEPCVKVGEVPGLRTLDVSSLVGKNWRNRSSVADRSTSVFSRMQKLYWVAVDSIVLAFRTISCPQCFAQPETPGILLSSGVRHSVAMTFSDNAHTPESVFSTSVWL